MTLNEWKEFYFSDLQMRKVCFIQPGQKMPEGYIYFKSCDDDDRCYYAAPSDFWEEWRQLEKEIERKYHESLAAEYDYPDDENEYYDEFPEETCPTPVYDL